MLVHVQMYLGVHIGQKMGLETFKFELQLVVNHDGLSYSQDLESEGRKVVSSRLSLAT